MTELENRPQLKEKQAVNIQPSLDATLAELRQCQVADAAILERLATLDVGERLSGDLTGGGFFVVDRINPDEYVVISSDAPERETPGLELERTIYRKIFQEQLEFVRQLHMATGQPIAELLTHYTTLIDQIGFDLLLDENEYAQLDEVKYRVQHDMSQLSGTHEPDWTQRAWQIMLDTYTTLEQTAQPVSPAAHEPRIGSFIYDLKEIDAKSATHYQLPLGERYLELHFPVKIIERTRGNNLPSPSSALREVATFLVQQKLDVTAITGASWLMSHSLAQRLGFTQTGVAGDDAFKEMGYWFQLIDENGNIKPAEVAYLHTHHKLRYDLAYGKMTTAEFLKRYGQNE